MSKPDPVFRTHNWSKNTNISPMESHGASTLYRDYRRACGPQDIPHYPIHLVNDHALLEPYVAGAAAEEELTVVASLGTYRYLDMEVTNRAALGCARVDLADQTAPRTRRMRPANTIGPD